VSEIQRNGPMAIGTSGLELSVHGLSVCYWEPVTGDPVFAVRDFGMRAAAGEGLRGAASSPVLRHRAGAHVPAHDPRLGVH